jgi:hypothetical protein
MQRTIRAYEKPSWIAQGLVVCLSIAVVLAAGRLASTIIFSHYATASAVDNTKRTSAPASVESVPSEPQEPPVAARANAASFEPFRRDDASAAPTPPPSALPLAPLAEPPSAATRSPGFSPWSTATAAPDVDFRSSPAKLPSAPLQAAESGVGVGPPSEVTGAIADLLRGPPPPPYPSPQAAEGRVVSIPVPRPRPRLESEDVPPDPDQSPFSAFDLFIERQR